AGPAPGAVPPGVAHEVREEREQRDVEARCRQPLERLAPPARREQRDREPERDERRGRGPAEQGEAAHDLRDPASAASRACRCSTTRAASWSGVKPKKRARSASGAEAPKRSIP